MLPPEHTSHAAVRKVRQRNYAQVPLSKASAAMNKQGSVSSEADKVPLTTGMHVYDSVHAYEEEAAGPAAAKAAAVKWVRKQRNELRQKTYSYSPLDWLAVFLPCVAWLRTYSVCIHVFLPLLLL